MNSKKRAASLTPSPGKCHIKRVAVHSRHARTSVDTPSVLKQTPSVRDVDGDSPWASLSSSRSAYTSRSSVNNRASTLRSSRLFVDLVPYVLPILDNTILSSRANTISWLSSVAFGITDIPLRERTFFIAVQIMDSYTLKELNGGQSLLSLTHKMEVIGFAALYLASKVEDAVPVDLDVILRTVSKKKYPIKKSNIITEERKILNSLGWTVSTSIVDNMSDDLNDFRRKVTLMISESCLFNAAHLSLSFIHIVGAIEHLAMSVEEGMDALDKYYGNQEALYFVTGMFCYVVYRWRRAKTVEKANAKMTRPSTTTSCTSNSTIQSNRSNKKSRPPATVMSVTLKRHGSLIETILVDYYDTWFDNQQLVLENGGLGALRDCVRSVGQLDITNLKKNIIN